MWLLLCAVFALAACAGQRATPTLDAAAGIEPEAVGLRVVWEAGAAEPQPGRPVTLRFAIVDARDGRRITDLPLTHERPVHLYAVSADLSDYHHLLPGTTPDSGFEVTFTPPRAGKYRLFAEFMHEDRAVVHRREFVVGAADGAAVAPRPDRGPTNAGGLSVELLGPQRINAGGIAPFTLIVSRDGQPVADLEPYLGAAAHIAILTADSSTLAHAYSKGLDTHEEDQGTTATASDPFGPRLGFTGAFPRAGLYALWVELRRDGQIIAVPFVIEVRP